MPTFLSGSDDSALFHLSLGMHLAAHAPTTRPSSAFHLKHYFALKREIALTSPLTKEYHISLMDDNLKQKGQIFMHKSMHFLEKISKNITR
jgi:hypothetical protein